MDQETIRLIGTLMGAVIAGLGGALIAGGYNRKNTQATIEASKDQWNRDRSAQHEQWQRDRASEHEKWLRDRKVDAYVNFLLQLRVLVGSAHDIKVGNLKDEIDSVVQERSNALETLHMELFAPEHVQKCALDTIGLAYDLINAAKAKDLMKEIHLDVTFDQKSIELERLIRLDLGSDSSGLQP
ncbi:hypothetical protein [Arthrobacter sp. NicSoilC5]|uniref:hypothetical protein n=1 Tax=Arthrobacter sp. NicSoilC5 TaxID=2831000 RepID=UPI001CC601F4|nr:hypothetical protein [Arthrobacter sp. NicSoilC5]BCW78312.1 hypothetical protein NicSoilC5_03310 [Arthrobacter sp. NicSoilC5]